MLEAFFYFYNTQINRIIGKAGSLEHYDFEEVKN